MATAHSFRGVGSRSDSSSEVGEAILLSIQNPGKPFPTRPYPLCGWLPSWRLREHTRPYRTVAYEWCIQRQEGHTCLCPRGLRPLGASNWEAVSAKAGRHEATLSLALISLELQLFSRHPGFRVHLFLAPQDTGLEREVNKDGAQDLRKNSSIFFLSPFILLLVLYKASFKTGTPSSLFIKKTKSPNY